MLRGYQREFLRVCSHLVANSQRQFASSWIIYPVVWKCLCTNHFLPRTDYGSLLTFGVASGCFTSLLVLALMTWWYLGDGGIDEEPTDDEEARRKEYFNCQTSS